MTASITVKTPASVRPAARRRKLVARVVHGPGSLPAPRVLGERPMQLGRTVSGEDDLPLDDPAVSRVHARVTWEAGLGAHVLTDCGSANGVYVNGARLASSRAIGAGDVVRLGESVLVVAEAAAWPDDDEDAMGLHGDSAVMTALRRTIRQVGPSGLPVLVVGATGTGKELVARALHARNGRDGAFIAINCAALAPTMIEATLFGHRKGAFTGATADQPGAFVAADGGTLFLDEVGDMPLEAQPKLLRALENGEVTAVGASTPRVVDVRVVAATHVPLAAAIEAGRFRDDLYARLAGVTVTTPRLAERRDDVIGLWRRFLPEAVAARPASADVVEALLVHDWPRNVRELRRLAERMALLHPDGERWELADLDPDLADQLARLRTGPASFPARPERRASDSEPEVEGPDLDDEPADKTPMPRDELLALLDACEGRVADVARRARRNRKQVYRWMDAYGIPRGTGRPARP